MAGSHQAKGGNWAVHLRVVLLGAVCSLSGLCKINILLASVIAQYTQTHMKSCQNFSLAKIAPHLVMYLKYRLFREPILIVLTWRLHILMPYATTRQQDVSWRTVQRLGDRNLPDSEGVSIPLRTFNRVGAWSGFRLVTSWVGAWSGLRLVTFRG